MYNNYAQPQISTMKYILTTKYLVTNLPAGSLHYDIARKCNLGSNFTIAVVDFVSSNRWQGISADCKQGNTRYLLNTLHKIPLFRETSTAPLPENIECVPDLTKIRPIEYGQNFDWPQFMIDYWVGRNDVVIFKPMPVEITGMEANNWGHWDWAPKIIFVPRNQKIQYPNSRMEFYTWKTRKMTVSIEKTQTPTTV